MERSVSQRAGAVDKRRQILDAAVTVFARQGFHATRVSDIADEAGVAYGLVYHYFNSKDQVLNELFLERWSLLLAAIEEAEKTDASNRDKLAAVAGFIFESYRHDPELMKVIIVEVHPRRELVRPHPPGGDPPRLRRDREDRRRRPGGGRVPLRRRPAFRLAGLLRRGRAAAHRVDLRRRRGRRRSLRRSKEPFRDDDLRRPRAALTRV